MIAAPLKQTCRRLHYLQYEHFRDHMIAAPLKLVEKRLRMRGLDVFPRSHDRGPIEASPYFTQIALNASLSAITSSRPPCTVANASDLLMSRIIISAIT